LECVACAYELADYLSFANLETPNIIDDRIMNTINLYSNPISDCDYDIKTLKDNLKSLMWDSAGIIRCEDKLLKALDKLNSMNKDFGREGKCRNTDEYEYRNMLTVAQLIVTAALERKESRGAHSRSDYTNISEKATHSTSSIKNAKEFSYA